MSPAAISLTAFLARPLRLAQSPPPSLSSDGRLAADVPGDELELVGGHEQAVARLAPLAGGVLEDEVLAGGARDRALHHLDVAADAVLVVDDRVARLELQRVDGVAPPRRHLLARVLAAEAARAGEVGLGEHDGAQQRALEADVEAAGGDGDDARRGRAVERLHEPGRDVGGAQDLDAALGRPVPLGGVDHRPALGEPAPDVLDGPLGLAAVRGRLPRRRARRCRPRARRPR